MNISDHMLYQKYILHLDNKKMSNGAFHLSKISKTLFEQFVKRYELDCDFAKNIDMEYKKLNRDEKINIICSDDEDFLNF